jgi:cell wall-associated NlpC family hydrolase
VAALVAALLLTWGPASVSVADPAPPVDPSGQALIDARVAEAAGVSAVADIEIQLAQQSAVRDAAVATAALAGQSYLAADQVRLDAVAAAAAAGATVAAADVQMESSRRTLVAIALQASRSGGAIDGVQAFLSADGFAEVAARSADLSRMGAKADRAVQEFRAATIVAHVLKERSDAASVTAARTADAAAAALAAANQAQADADATVAAASAQRDVLIVQLAAARSTTVEIENALQDQLDADSAARANAAAEAVRTASGAGAPGLGEGTSRGSAAQGAAAVAWATTQLNLPYLWGAAGPDSYDCSGLTSQAWLHAGRAVARTASGQYAQVLKIAYSDLRPGDLIFWAKDPADVSSVYHVAMYAGGGQIIESPKPGAVSRITPMAGRWASTMMYAGRP